MTATGLANGKATFALRGDGELDGDGDLAIDQLRASGARLSKPIDLGNCSLGSIYAISTRRIALENVRARSGTATVASGDLTLSDPLDSKAALLARVNSIRIDLARLKTWLAVVRALPKPLAWLTGALISGSWPSKKRPTRET